MLTVSFGGNILTNCMCDIKNSQINQLQRKCDTFVHQTPFNHNDFSDSQTQSGKENPQFSGIVPSAEEKEPELHPVVSVPQKESVVDEENLEETVEESEICETPDKTGKRDTSLFTRLGVCTLLSMSL